MLIASLIILGLAVVLGLRLAGRYIYAPPQASRVSAACCVHGGFGAAGLVSLAAALRRGPSPHAIRLGVGGFGQTALIILAVALGLGLVFLTLRMARRAVPLAAVALHGFLAIAGAVLLMAYAGLQD